MCNTEEMIQSFKFVEIEKYFQALLDVKKIITASILF